MVPLGMLRRSSGAWWVFALIVLIAAIGAVDAFSEHKPDICSLEYQAAYLETHDTDAVLRKECPHEPWYRDRD
jgi:hypothetical protein